MYTQADRAICAYLDGMATSQTAGGSVAVPRAGRRGLRRRGFGAAGRRKRAAGAGAPRRPADGAPLGAWGVGVTPSLDWCKGKPKEHKHGRFPSGFVSNRFAKRICHIKP